MVDTRAELSELYRRVRSFTERLAGPLGPEDQMLQSMPSCSPTKWHRAHTTWFFETFVLAPRGIAALDARWSELFNSYYVSLGPRHARDRRGLLSRPTVDEVEAYRRTIDARVLDVIGGTVGDELAGLAEIVALGLAHEEQHQELLLTDILNALNESPLRPAYRSARGAATPRPTGALRFIGFEGGVHAIGASRAMGFCFDHEEPRHDVLVAPFELSDRLVTVGEWKAFEEARGYDRPELWLSDGFAWAQTNGVRAPLYLSREGETLVQFGLEGERVPSDDEPLAHVSYYEADAIARFLGARLPTELEWEIAASRQSVEGNLLDGEALRALPATGDAEVRQLFGDAWEWTRSAFAAYPGYRPRPGALGEYNGKFMVNQVVLRGGSYLTPTRHVRASYRNFWHPDTRFQVTGIRLARDLGGA